ncbi:MAG: LptF/LptG family permease [Spirochaetota bacterium]
MGNTVVSRAPMDILDRYIFRNFLKAFAGTLLLLVGVSVIVKILDSLKDFTENQHGVALLFEYYLVVTPSFVTYIVPPALMFATAFTISNFNRNFEITVMLAAGRSFRRILRPLLIFTALFSVAFFLFNEYVAFPSAYRAVDISYQLRNKGDDARLRKYDKSGDMTLRFGNRYYTIGHGAWYRRELIGFHLLEISEQGSILRIVEADSATVENHETRQWQMKKVRITRFNEQGIYTGTDSHEVLALELAENLRAFQNFYVEMDSEERSLFDAFRIYQKRKQSGGSYEAFLTEVFWHIGYPLVCLFIVFIGGMLGGKLKKGGVPVSIAVSMLFTLGYFFFMYFGTAFGDSGTLPPFFAGNLANLVAGSLSAWIYFRLDY